MRVSDGLRGSDGLLVRLSAGDVGLCVDLLRGDGLRGDGLCAVNVVFSEGGDSSGGVDAGCSRVSSAVARFGASDGASDGAWGCDRIGRAARSPHPHLRAPPRDRARRSRGCREDGEIHHKHQNSRERNAKTPCQITKYSGQ